MGSVQGILADMTVTGIIKEYGEKKVKTMFLIEEKYTTLAEYLGGRKEVTY